MDLELPEASGISEKDSEVLGKIEEEALSNFTFDGIRRLTRYHPETLSRSLVRLEAEGLLVRTPEGYSVRAHGTSGQRGVALKQTRIPLLHTILPYDLDPDTVARFLAGRWFDRLRWVGISNGLGEVVLKWVTDDGGAQIDAVLRRGELDVEARVQDERDLDSAVKASHQLVTKISKFYSGEGTGKRMTYPIRDAGIRFPSAM
jgi:hypothetical protein